MSNIGRAASNETSYSVFFLVAKLTNVIRCVIDTRITMSKSEKLSALHGLEPSIHRRITICMY